MSRNFIISISILLFGLLLSLFVLYTPRPNSEIETQFNTKFAMEYIAELSETEHSVYDPENHEDVRLYLKDMLTEFLGEDNVTEMDYLASEFELEEELTYDVRNLLGIIPGQSDTAILIVAHYDSRGQIGRDGELGNSYGAADDGYGIATMLEIARLYADKDMENTIYLLMTDAEETGLLGASKAALETSLMDNVGFVINIEARGVDGPAYMFETSVNNDKVIDFYKSAHLPVSYSLATAVYTVMPNSTDFTEFLAQDLNGVNFAVLSGIYYYHTPHDNYTNINPSSIEHYGAQILPMVDEFVMNSEYSDVDYFDADSNQVFFTLFPNVFIAYNENIASVIHVLLFVLLIGLGVYFFIKKEITLKKYLASSIVLSIGIVGAVLIGSIVGRFIAFLSKVPFNMTYVRTELGDIPTLIVLVGLTIFSGYLYKKYTTNHGVRISILWTGAVLNAFLALVTGFVLSGASFLFLVPALSSLIIMLFITFCKSNIVKHIVFGLIMVLNLLVVVPIIYSLYLALTVGGLLALGVILIFYLVTLVPLFFAQLELK